MAVIEAIAAEKGVEPVDLECVLADAIGPIALNTLFEPTAESTRPAGFVEFPFCGHIVTVRADGTVDVR